MEKYTKRKVVIKKKHVKKNIAWEDMQGEEESKNFFFQLI